MEPREAAGRMWGGPDAKNSHGVFALKHIVHSFRTGETATVDVPCPAPGARQALVRTCTRSISAGPGKMPISFAEAPGVSRAVAETGEGVRA